MPQILHSIDTDRELVVTNFQDRLAVLRWEMALGTGTPSALEILRQIHNAIVTEMHNLGLSVDVVAPLPLSDFGAATMRLREVATASAANEKLGGSELMELCADFVQRA